MRTFRIIASLFTVLLSSDFIFCQLNIVPYDPAYASSVPPQFNDSEFVPGTGISYRITNAGLGINMYGCSVGWEVDKGIIFPHTRYIDGSYQFSNSDNIAIRWDNVTGPGQLKATFASSSGCAYSGRQVTISVNIRYVGKPGNLTISGHGSTAVLSCGIQTVTLSATAATNATHYHWNNIPASWTGSRTTTSPTATFQTDINSSASDITVSASRSDVPDIKNTSETSVTIGRPQVTISNLSLAENNILTCNPSSTHTISATGVNADKFEWTPSANVRINGSASPQLLTGSASISATAAGSFTVRAYSTACNKFSSNSITKGVSYGPPSITPLVNGIAPCCYPQEVPNGSRIAIPAAGASSYSWTLLAGTAPITPVTNAEHMCDVGYIIDYARIEGTASNSCGSTTHLFYLVPPGGALLAYPNPTKETLMLEFVNPPERIELYNENSNIAIRQYDSKKINKIKTNNKNNNYKIEIDVRDLPRGPYYLHFKKEGGSIEKLRVLLK